MPPDARETSIGELAEQLSEQSSTLARQERRLAQLESQEKGRRAGIGLGVLGVAGIVAFIAAEALVAAVVLALDSDLKTWASAAIVGLALLVLAGVLALTGKRRID